MAVMFTAWALLGLAPMAAGGAWYSWTLHSRSRAQDLRIPKPRVRLSLILAITGTIGAAGAAILAAASGLYLLGFISIVQRLSGVTVLVYIPLVLIPIINAAYLRWLDAQGGDS